MDSHAEKTREWVGAYYPSMVMDNPRTKTIASLLFDRIICHFPVSPMMCGGGQGMSDFYCDDPLVQANVIELREEFLLDEVEVDSTPEHPWGTEDEFSRFVDLNVTGMALGSCREEGAVPVTDSPGMQIPAFMLQGIETLRASRLQASAVALTSLDLALPPFAALEPEEVLEARDKLNDELAAFRYGMLSLAPKIRSGVTQDAALPEIYDEARYIAETAVIPALEDIKRRLKGERGRLWRRLLQKGLSGLPRIALSWTTKSWLGAAVQGVQTAKDLALEQIDHESLVHALRHSGGLGYLISASQLTEKEAPGR